LKLSNELKVGILALSAIALLIWGYAFLKGKNIFSNNKVVYAVYENVDGLTKSSTVMISGLKVGVVSKIDLLPDFSGKVLVTMEIKQDVKVPRRTTVADLVDMSLLGGKSIKLNYTGACQGDDCIQDGDTIPGDNIGMVDNITKEIDPYIQRFQKGYYALDSIYKEFVSKGGGADDLGLNKTLVDFQSTLSNLNATTRNLNLLIKNSSGDIQGTLSNFSAISKNLKEQEGDINRVMSNVAKFSDRLEALELEETVDSTQMTFAQVNKSLRTLDAAILDIQSLVNTINKGDGTVSKLLNDDEVYTKIEAILKSIELLTDDVRLNPKRYINLRRKSIPYEEKNDPADKGNNE